MSTSYIRSDVPTLLHGTPAASQWYAIYTRPSHEKRVAVHFGIREIEFFLPSYCTTHRWKNRCKVQLDLPLFPGYVFACFPWAQHARVLEVPSVVSIVGNGRVPLPLAESEMGSLRAGLQVRRAEPHPYLNVGERARIKSGPLMGFEGVVLRKSNGLRFVLSLHQIMRSIAVEVEECDLEPVTPVTPATFC